MENNNQHKVIYFASDLHLGVPDAASSKLRELKFIEWLDYVQKDAVEIFLLGDIFDMWFEYKEVIPKGYTRLLGKLAQMTDQGIKIHFFTGNHDMWMFDYFPKELNIPIYRKPEIMELNGLKCMIGHGDGLGSGDKGYKILKTFFESKTCQWLFARLHPNFGLGMAHHFSKKSRIANGNYNEEMKNEEKEILINYCKNFIKKEHIDLFVFGHRHIPIEIKLNESSSYVNTGEWVNYFSYFRMDGNKFELKSFK